MRHPNKCKYYERIDKWTTWCMRDGSVRNTWETCPCIFHKMSFWNRFVDRFLYEGRF